MPLAMDHHGQVAAEVNKNVFGAVSVTGAAW
jgi:hypothetical protein